MSSLIDKKFAELAAKNKTAFIAYITAGHPTLDLSIDLMRGLEKAGVDILEVGVPFSDPMADGPVIQRSSQRAIEQGMNLRATLDLIGKAGLSIPVVLFSYLNPVLAFGNSLPEEAIKAGVSGILITDLPVGADSDREAWFASSGLDFIRLVAPTTPNDRMAEISRNGSGFVYLVSRTGVTGEQSVLPSGLAETAARLKMHTELPVCIGFGISDAKQARAVGDIADGVIVGSALVRAADSSIDSAVSLAVSIREGLDA